jgi:hypothetical protein
MKNVKLKLAIFGALGLASAQAMAALAVLPTSGTSPYVQCRTASNFGAQADTTLPGAGDSACVVTNGVGAALTLNSTPEPGFVLSTSNTSTITAFSETLGTLNERVFVNSPSPISQCIYAKQIVMSNTGTHDYNPQRTGVNRMEVNDFAFGGYTGAVSAGYAKNNATTNSSVFRIGRTFTSVQMQPNVVGGASVAPGYQVLPPAGGTLGVQINGVGQTLTPPGTPTAAQQEAAFSGTHNWVDFTTDVVAGADEDGSTNPGAPNMYIKQACTANTTTPTAGNFELRQTGQETQPFVFVTGTSRAPGTSIAP